MGHGGKREGAGKPKGYKAPKTLEKEEARRVLREMVLASMTPMVEAQIKHAQGINYLVYREKRGGKFTKVTAADAQAIFDRENRPADEGGVIIEVWDKDPSVQAFTDLFNRALDKPAEQEQNINLKMPGMEAILARLEEGRKRVGNAKRG